MGDVTGDVVGVEWCDFETLFDLAGDIAYDILTSGAMSPVWIWDLS